MRSYSGFWPPPNWVGGQSYFIPNPAVAPHVAIMKTAVAMAPNTGLLWKNMTSFFETYVKCYVST